MTKPAVLITGATGHIGYRTLVFLLEAGYQAHITSRTPEQISKIKSAPSVQRYLSDLSFYIVPDVIAPNAYDEAIQGVQYVVHIASPIANLTAKPKDKTWKQVFYDPAKLGTLTMLRAAAKTPSVKRVVVTSSVVVLEASSGKDLPGPKDVMVAPDDDAAEKLEGVFPAYTASKVMAHTVADDFVRDNKPSFDLVRVLPGYTQGANELNLVKADIAGGTNGALLGTATGQISDGPKLTAQVFLDDVAKAHVLALRPEIASNGDNLVVAGNGGVGIPWDEVAEVIEHRFPKEVASGELKPVKGQQDWITRFDVTSSEKALGFKFAGATEMVDSVVSQYLALPASR